MNEALVPAYVVHTLPGWLRIRIPGKRGNETYFADLCKQLAIRPGVVAVSANPRSGAVLLGLAPDIGLARIAAHGWTLALFDLRASAMPPAPPDDKRSALVAASASFNRIDRFIAEATGGSLDLKSGVVLVLLALAARQIIKGHFMVPGFTFLWCALTMMME